MTESPRAGYQPPDPERTEIETLRLAVASLTERNRLLEAEAEVEPRRTAAPLLERIAELEREVERRARMADEADRLLELERARLARIGRFLPIETVRRLRARLAGSGSGTDETEPDGEPHR